MKTQTKLVGPIISSVMVLILAVAGFVSFSHANADRVAHEIITIHGIVGSEKQSFFEDQIVKDEFRKKGIDIQVTAQGSREEATTATKDGADFYFPAGEPAGRAISQKLGIKNASTPFYTPMVIASWDTIAKTLAANGIAEKRNNYWYIVHMNKMLNLIDSGKRWNQLPHNADYDVSKSIQISSTDVRKSNSAGMYLALASYTFNGNNIVTTPEQTRKIQNKLNGIFLNQGFQETSSAGPFEDYVMIGKGKAPLVICYEQQYIEYLAATPEDQRPKGMIILYPKPTIFTKHTIVPTDDSGNKVAELLSNDTVLIQAEIRHGFRNGNLTETHDFWSKNKINLPTDIQDVIEAPSFQTIESMIKGIDDAFSHQ